MAEPVAWLALLPTVPDGVTRAARVREGGQDAGWLCAWLLDPDAPGGRRRPARDAVRCPADLLGPGDGPWAVSLSLPDRAVRPIHDDPAVVAATRAAARDGGLLAFTVGLVADEVHWAGGLSGVDEATAAAWPGWTSVDPWHRLGPSRLLTVGAGVLRAAALPASPGHQRRGGAPWPAGRFAA